MPLAREYSRNLSILGLDYRKYVNLSDDCLLTDINKAFKATALKTHPDRNSSGNSAEDFRRAEEARSMLMSAASEARRQVGETGREAYLRVADESREAARRAQEIEDGVERDALLRDMKVAQHEAGIVKALDLAQRMETVREDAYVRHSRVDDVRRSTAVTDAARAVEASSVRGQQLRKAARAEMEARKRDAKLEPGSSSEDEQSDGQNRSIFLCWRQGGLATLAVSGLALVLLLIFASAATLPQHNGSATGDHLVAKLDSFGELRMSTETKVHDMLKESRAASYTNYEQDVDPKANDETVHIVFSTDCSGYQHWQGIALWYAAKAAGQEGPISRIASGCSSAQQYLISKEWRSIDPSDTFRVHFTPPMELHSDGHGSYKYSNKPGGIRHWLANAVPTIQEKYVCLVDPDMLMLRPITVNLAEGLMPVSREGRSQSSQKQYELADTTGVGRLLATNIEGMPPKVGLGHPAGQHFGIGGQWAKAMTQAARPGSAWAVFSKAAVCGPGAPCTTTTQADADSKYAAGPVYLAHIDDWRRIADQWWRNMPEVHRQYPQLLAEMYSFCMAVANLTLPWTLVSSYMVSDPKTQSPTEAWTWVEDLAKGDGGPAAVCAGATATSLPTATRDRSAVALPAMAHHCQKYDAFGHLFAKHRVPHDFFSCTGSPIPFDAGAIIDSLTEAPSKTSMRTAFMLCHLIPMVNSALESYKRDVCSGTGRD